VRIAKSGGIQRYIESFRQDFVLSCAPRDTPNAIIIGKADMDFMARKFANLYLSIDIRNIYPSGYPKEQTIRKEGSKSHESRDDYRIANLSYLDASASRVLIATRDDARSIGRSLDNARLAL
jgi:hypothetical protein